MDDERAHDPETGPGGAATGAAASGPDRIDPLLEVRTALDEVGRLPLEERAEVFERTHRVVVAELRALELG